MILEEPLRQIGVCGDCLWVLQSQREIYEGTTT
jgi:hypothetical protein